MAGVTTSHTLVIQQGDDRPLVWKLADASGVPIADLTGYTARAQVRERPDSSVVLQEWSTAAGTAVLAASSLSLKLTGSTGWTWSYGVYDIRITDPTSTTEVVDRGPVVVVPVITR